MASPVRMFNNNNQPVASDNPFPIINLSGLIPENYDEILLTYVASGDGVGEVETVVYKKSSVVIATLTLSYNAEDNLSGVLRS